MFLAFNNGVVATADEVRLEREGGAVFLTGLRGLQIVNGGQTTASLQAQLAELIALVKEANERERAAAAETARRRGVLKATIDSEARKNAGPRPQSFVAQQRGQALIRSAAAAVREAEQTQARAVGERDRAQASLEAAEAAARASSMARSQDEAIAAGQNLITTMILQTLNVQPR